MVIASIAFGFSLNLGYRATEVLYGIRKYASRKRSGEGGRPVENSEMNLTRERWNSPLKKRYVV